MSERHIPAFKETLEVSKYDKGFGNLSEFKNDKRYVVREAHPHLFEEGQEVSSLEAAKILRDLFNELRTAYNINAPVQFVVAENDKGEPRLFNLTNNIEPAGTLDEEERQKMVHGLLNIFRSLMSYYESKYASQENFLSDIPIPFQYVYGKKEGDTHNEWYLVDTDPFFSDTRETLFDATENLKDSLEELEKEYKVDMSDITERAQALMEKIEAEPQIQT